MATGPRRGVSWLIVTLLVLAAVAPAGARTGSVEEFAIPTPMSLPAGMAPGPDGNLWFAEISGKTVPVL